MRLSPTILCLSVAVLLAVALTPPGLSAQNAARETASGSGATGTQAAPEATLRTSANLVLVDVVATDRDEPVLGLERKAFHVFEDGKEQPISSFDVHQPAVAVAPPAFLAGALPANTYTNLPATPPSSAVNVLLLDALNTPLNDQMLVRRKMIDYLGSIKPGTTLAIFTLSTQLRMITAFTTDAGGLAKALKSPKANTQQSALLDTQQTSDLNTTRLNAVDGGANDPSLRGESPSSVLPSEAMNAVDELRRFEADQGSFQIDVRVRTTLSAMQQLARYLGGIDGRKNVIWFSEAFPIVMLPDQSLGLSGFANINSYRESMQKTGDMLTAARVAIYPVDARALWVPSQFSATRGFVLPAQATNPNSITQEDEEVHNQQTAMQVLAEETGGKAYVDTNDFDKAVADAVKNGSSYYTIAYVPPGAHLDGKYHKIQVRVDGDRGVKLQFRRGYYADAAGVSGPDQAGATGSFAEAIAHDAPATTQLLFRARVLAAADPQLQGAGTANGPAGQITIKGTAHRYVIDLTLDAHGLTFNPGPDGSHEASLELAMVAYDGKGQAVNFYQHSFHLGLKDAQMERILASGIALRLPFDLPAGEINLRIGVHDLNANRAGSLEVTLPVSER